MIVFFVDIVYDLYVDIDFFMEVGLDVVLGRVRGFSLLVVCCGSDRKMGRCCVFRGIIGVLK